MDWLVSGLLELLACIPSFSSHPLGGALRNCKIGVGINIPISEVFKRSEIDILFESFEAVIASNVLGAAGMGSRALFGVTPLNRRNPLGLPWSVFTEFFKPMIKIQFKVNYRSSVVFVLNAIQKAA